MTLPSQAPPSPVRSARSRRPETAARLLDAVPDVIARTGYEALTVRAVAAAAGVSPQTAYNHFSSKEHLVASVYWRRLVTAPALEFTADRTVAQRVEQALSAVALAVADEPELARGVTVALLAGDADVVDLRSAIGEIMLGRLDAACGDAVPARARNALGAMLVGALLMAGLQLMQYGQLPALLGDFADLVVAGTRGGSP